MGIIFHTTGRRGQMQELYMGHMSVISSLHRRGARCCATKYRSLGALAPLFSRLSLLCRVPPFSPLRHPLFSSFLFLFLQHSPSDISPRFLSKSSNRPAAAHVKQNKRRMLPAEYAYLIKFYSLNRKLLGFQFSS